MKRPITVTLTGAAGRITYALLFRIAAGEFLGPDQPIALRLLEIPEALTALRGTLMELEDCAFPLLDSVIPTSSPTEAFANTDYAFLIGARPRSAAMERKDLLEVNAAIFATQGRALNEAAHPDVRVLVVGNPANTNALIALHNAPDLGPRNFSAMTRLDHNRAVGLLARKLKTPLDRVRRVAVWGNHSATQYPDLCHARIDDQPVIGQIDPAWYTDEYIPAVQQRGTRVIEARGQSSAASAAHAAICHMRDWALGTRDGDWTSAAVLSQTHYGITPGLFFSCPVVSRGDSWHVVEGLAIDPSGRAHLERNERELLAERDVVRALLPG